MSIDIKKRVPPIIRTQDVWKDFLDVISTELENVKTEIEDKSKYLNIELYTDVYELIALSRSLGYSPNIILDSSLDFVKKEVESIVFKIRNKAIYNYYNYLFKLIPYSGNIYVMYKDHLKLIRAIDITNVYSNLNTHDLKTPFTQLESIAHYDEYRDQEIILDADPLFYLDSTITWYLNQDIVVKPTNHLALEYAVNKIFTENNTDYLMTKDYFNYLEVGVSYGRKVTDVPHIGAQVSMFMSENGYYDTFNIGSDYSIDDLKLKCSVTDFYKDNDPRDLVYLEDTDLTLDEQVTWFLDQDAVIEVTKENSYLFDKVVVGTGSRSLFAIGNRAINEDLILHCSFEDPDTTTMTDHSPSEYDLEIQGDFTLIPGSSGKAVRFNGVNTCGYIDEFLISNETKTYAFWIKADRFGQLTNNPRLLYQNGFLNFYYNNIDKQLKFTIIGSSLSKTMSYDIDIDNKEMFIIVEINLEKNHFNLIIDGKARQTLDISSIGSFSSDKPLYIGGSDSGDYFRGYIDELRVYNKVLTEENKLFLYTSKIGSLQYLSNKIYSAELSTNEFDEGSNFKSIHCSIPANTLNEEVIATGDGSSNTFTGYLANTNLIPSFLKLKYYSFPNHYDITSNSRGELVGERASGTIDYETGEFSLTTYKETTIAREVISNGTPVKHINYTADHQNIKPGSLSINFWVGDSNYNITDRGDGVLTGTGISGTGTINHDTGFLECSFTSLSDSGKDVYIAYEYIAYSTPDINAEITAEYKLRDNIEITEAGIEDVDGNLTVYSTFPPTQFNSRYNHLSLQFFIRKQ